MMKKIGMQMSILMGITLSFFLSLSGNLLSGHFTIAGFLVSFAVSTMISLVIGFRVPVRKISQQLCKMLTLKPHSLSELSIESLVSDIAYTPIITLCMVFLAYKIAVKHGASINFTRMFVPALIISMILGYVLIFIFQPLYLKILFKANHIDPKNQAPQE